MQEARENLTPEKGRREGRSRKCLHLSAPTAGRGAPLSDTANLPSPLATPRRRPGSPELLLSSPLPSPTYSTASIIPATVAPPKTPRAVLADPIRRRNLASASRASPLRGVQLARRREAELPVKAFSPRRRHGAGEEAAGSQERTVVAIQTGSFYSKPAVRTPEAAVVPRPREVRSAPTVPRAGARGRSARRAGGGTRKAGGKLRGVGHAIKKPKFKPSPFPSLKISELPAMSIEVPRPAPAREEVRGVVSAPGTPAGTPSSRRTAGVRPSGSLHLTPHTKVQFEVRAGQVVYRARPKAGLQPRRSPRKHLSPLKAEYFRAKTPVRQRPGGEKRLFSPEANFLNPSASQDGRPALPSPVKFHDTSQESAEEQVPDLSDILASLNSTEERSSEGEGEVEGEWKEQGVREQEVTAVSSLPGELALSVPLEGESASLRLAMDTMEELAGVEREQAAPTISSILGELSSGEDSQNSSQSSSQSSEDEAPLRQEGDPSKLFPIFYKDSARSGEVAPAGGSSMPQGRRFLCSSLPADQAYIDAGQRELGATVCQVCGTVYTKGDPADEAAHAAQHSGLLDRLKMVGWKNERVVGEFPEGRVVCVRPGDDPRWWRKVEEVLGVVDRDLGFSEVGIRHPDRTKVYMFVAERRVVGLLLAEQISQGFPLLPPSEGSEGSRVYCCSEAGVPTMAGVSRVWTLADHRRRGVASALVDAMRSTFFADKYLQERDFAFSDPTIHGINFASRYIGHSSFLVYNR